MFIAEKTEIAPSEKYASEFEQLRQGLYETIETFRSTGHIDGVSLGSQTISLVYEVFPPESSFPERQQIIVTAIKHLRDEMEIICHPQDYHLRASAVRFIDYFLVHFYGSE